MKDVANLIKRYRSHGILVDSNLLVLLAVGRWDPLRIETFKRTAHYSIDDYRLLQKLLSRFARCVVTPNVLTETSNLLSQLGEPAREKCFREFSIQIQVLHEEFIDSKTAAIHERFPAIGLTDISIWLAAERRFLILTDDLRLYGILSAERIDAVNFNHIRPFGWT